MKLKYFNLAVVESSFWGVGIGLFLSLFLARHCPLNGATGYWIQYWGFGFLIVSMVVNAIRERNLRKK